MTPEFGKEPKAAELGHDEQLSVSVIEEAVVHGGIRGVKVNSDAGL